MRLGLFGGTFNPIHIGHLRAAVEVRESFRLDKVLLIPSAHPPHKNADDLASPEDRFEMVGLAIDGIPFLEASDVEIIRSGPSYTIETLQYFQRQYGSTSVIHFILGIDAFSEITTWKLYKRLFAAANEPKVLYEILGADHNDTYDVGGREYFERLSQFIHATSSS